MPHDAATADLYSNIHSRTSQHVPGLIKVPTCGLELSNSTSDCWPSAVVGLAPGQSGNGIQGGVICAGKRCYCPSI
ncbi:hypothetical protein MGG_15738 [Pyricularia oryzae 70-15]|uniref:Uncharacterized protein n=1 Tax=Pyricularia oryzae (strain 70-15 / ATCC MYA-4617 / FGSC 8958) TaxID=242507 RepID=G4MTX8_PYRO7|nr:uncharacterized protein MGG_15738 [Pyricularia oryzae 70-15]EHA54772.1 hypothetical protein MGG_15738 [Pyricularia oryzae 70-15]